jgi:ATP-binding cassette subfamily B (MDR/TAP) protein 10
LNAYENTLKLDMAKFDLMGTNVTPLLSDQDKPKVLDSSKALANESETGKEVAKKSEDAASAPKQSRLASALSLSAVPETTPDTGVRGVGDIISRLGSDSSIVGESLTRELSEGLRALATVVVGVGMMIFISAKLTAVMLCIVPPTAIGAVFYGRYLKKLSRRTQKKVGEMIAVAEERLSSIRTVQAFNAVNPYETSRFNKKANDILDLAKKEAYASGLFYGGAGFSGNITMLALLSYGGKLVSQGEITVG